MCHNLTMPFQDPHSLTNCTVYTLTMQTNHQVPDQAAENTSFPSSELQVSIKIFKTICSIIIFSTFLL